MLKSRRAHSSWFDCFIYTLLPIASMAQFNATWKIKCVIRFGMFARSWRKCEWMSSTDTNFIAIVVVMSDRARLCLDKSSGTLRFLQIFNFAGGRLFAEHTWNIEEREWTRFFEKINKIRVKNNTGPMRHAHRPKCQQHTQGKQCSL